MKYLIKYILLKIKPKNIEVLNLIRERKNIPKRKINFIKITVDGNCLFRDYSYYLYNY